jgi:hypothetical protein
LSVDATLTKRKNLFFIMKASELITQRFKELLTSGISVLNTRRSPPSNVIGDDRVDYSGSQEWATSAADMLRRTFGADSEYYQRFNSGFKHAGYYSDMARAVAVVKAAANDYSKGYLIQTTSLVRAEVFGDFLEQSEHLLEQGFYHAAAVLAGGVLEDSLRRLCEQNSITLSAKPKLDTMNAELAKRGIYNALVQKRVTWLADIRNKAAHGQWLEFTKSDVDRMLPQIRDFVTDYGTV